MTREERDFWEEDYQQDVQKADLALQLQRFLADVESKKTYPYINKDFAYTRLNENDIGVMEQRFRTLNMVVDHLRKLSGKEDMKSIFKAFSCTQYILGMNVSTAILRQSKDGWARELTITKRLLTKFNKLRYGLLKREEEMG